MVQLKMFPLYDGAETMLIQQKLFLASDELYHNTLL